MEPELFRLSPSCCTPSPSRSYPCYCHLPLPQPFDRTPNTIIRVGIGQARSSSRGGKGAAVLNTAPENSFTLRFCYLPSLGIVAVTPSSNVTHAILANLFPNDTGQNTPNPTNHHSRAAKLSPSGLFQYPADLPCRPYRWAQWLAGLHFPPVSSSDGQMPGASEARRAIEPSTRAVVAALRSRIRTQWALAAQLKSLADKKPACLPRFQEMMPTSNNVELGRCVMGV